MNTRPVFRNRDTSVLNFMGRSISAIFLKVNRSVISAASSSYFFYCSFYSSVCFIGFWLVSYKNVGYIEMRAEKF